MDIVAREQLKKKNLEIFDKYYPPVAIQLKDYIPMSSLEIDDQGEADTCFSGEYFYNKKHKEYVEKQLINFDRAPVRLGVSPPQTGMFDEYAGEFLFSILKRANEAGLEFHQKPTSPNSFFLIVFGLGLGGHLIELVKKTKCFHLLIIEPNIEFIFHSLEVMDWQELFEIMEERDGNIEFIIENRPEVIAVNTRVWTRLINPSSVDGLHIFTHYNHPVFTQAQKLIRDDLKILLSGLGFFYDETIMLRNTHANLYSGKARVYLRPDNMMVNTPVFVVGCGPSLDKDLEFLKNNQDRAIIISCGSAISPLLNNGITPDYQIEIENINVELIISQIASKFDISKINLVTASTVDQAIIPYFDNVNYYFRGALSPYPIFCDSPLQCILHPSPTVVNAGLSFAQEVGFRDFYIFGADMGTKNKNQHHSTDSYHYSEKRQIRVDEGKEKDPVYDVEVGGNFGGTVYTNNDMFWTKDVVQASISKWNQGRTYYNCSDGANIEGTIPKPSKAVKLADLPSEHKTNEKAKVQSVFPVYTKEKFESCWQDDMIVDCIKAFIVEIQDALDSSDTLTNMTYLLKLNKIFLQSEGKYTLAMALLFRGSIWQALLGLEYYMNRIIGDEDREEKKEEYSQIAKEELHNLLVVLREKAISTLGQLSDKTSKGIYIDPLD